MISRITSKGYIHEPRRAEWVKVNRLGECPNGGGGYCTSACSPNGHRSPWKTIWSGPPADVASWLRANLAKGNNYDIEIAAYDERPPTTFKHYFQVDRAFRLADEDIPAFVRRLQRLLGHGYRTRLYGDDHPVSVAA